MKLPRIYLGTMTFGWDQASTFVDSSIAISMVSVFASSGHTHIDTARIYSSGACEAIVASSISNYPNLLIGTKAHPSEGKGLSTRGIQEQFSTSTAALKLKTVEEYYLHQPDTSNDLLESLIEADKMVKSGTIKKIGLSNYHSSEVQRAFDLCSSHNLTPPTLYQGIYNPLNRMIEEDLIHVLRNNDCAFIAYNPLAAGLLTGRHTAPPDSSEIVPGRFKNNPNYLPRFYTTENFQALKTIIDACENHEIEITDASYMWLLRYSVLGENDGLLIGASSLGQLEGNLKACKEAEEGELPEEVLEAMNNAWEITKEGAFPYWRSYSKDMPGREDLDQGASYSANKTK
ncbi:hypothetical protein TrLO_g5723 [Triparma laevis f. longispina]|uniref:NADP-dependent oxidoreductase domain-containing protein n=1 Tax=Triparma laevis f. longispina TaxID=1714387 RepID=A0A9W7E746_9STRA|nr:hypothetical protein TrLO_g5723 [Triparma laevis f. longispina]